MKIRHIALALIGGAMCHVAFADDASHVRVVELRQTDAALRATYVKGERTPLPRLMVFDEQRRIVFAAEGFYKDVDRRVREAVRRDHPMRVQVTLDAVLAETESYDGTPMPVDKLPPGKVYVVDYWAEWCGPCKMLTHTLESALGDWKDTDSVWIKIESDPHKKSKG